MGPEEHLEPEEPWASAVTGHELEEPVFFEELVSVCPGPWQGPSRPQLRIARDWLVPEKSWGEGAFQASASLSAVLAGLQSPETGGLVMVMRVPRS